MPSEINYAIFDIPKIGFNLAASRTPRFKPTVPAEVAEMFSGEVARGEWGVDPTDGHPKHVVEAPPVPGQRSRIGASHAAYTGPGQAALDDEKELPIKDHAKALPLHPSTTSKQRAALHPIANDPNVILQDAAALGRKA